MAESDLSFSELERRLRQMPDGPSGILVTPKLYRILNWIGWTGMLIALLPHVLMRFMTPAMWMVSMAQIGFAILLMAWLPVMLRSSGVIGWTLWRWKSEQVRQLDHDHPHFQELLRWLSGFSVEALGTYRGTAQLAQRQLTAKMGLLAGGIDRLGVLPVLASVYLFLRNWKDPLNMPSWQLGLGVFLLLLYLITCTASLMRIRLQLYESMFSDALARKHHESDTAA